MLMANAFPLLTNAVSMLLTVTVLLASKDTISSKDNVSSLPSTTPSLLILDVEPGTGTSKFAFSAQRALSSISTKFVLPLLISAKLLTAQLVTVLLATKVMTLAKDNVSTLLQTVLDLQISAVPFGTGKIKFA